MALDVDQIAAMRFRWRAPEMIEPDIVERRRGLEARDVAAEIEILLSGAQHLHDRVPAHERTDPVLELVIARRRFLGARRNRVEVGGVRAERQVGAVAARLVDQPLEQEVSTLRALAIHHSFERIEPIGRFLWIAVRHGGLAGGGLRGESVHGPFSHWWWLTGASGVG